MRGLSENSRFALNLEPAEYEGPASRAVRLTTITVTNRHTEYFSGKMYVPLRSHSTMKTHSREYELMSLYEDRPRCSHMRWRVRPDQHKL